MPLFAKTGCEMF